MPVISRLDEQVDDVLIKPLSKKGGREDEHADAPARPSAPRPAGEAAEDADADDAAPGRRRPPRELPVWML